MKRTLVSAAVVLTVLALAYLGVGLFVAARLSAPDREPLEATPADLEYKEVGFDSTDGVPLRAWWVPGDGVRAAVLVHGWGGNRSDRYVLETAPVYAERGYGVLMLDLRGHGESGGDRRTSGYKEIQDVRGALAWLEGEGYEPGEVVLHGWSMGGATVVRSAPGTGVAAVVEEAGYADLPLLLREELPERSSLPRLFNPGILLAAKLFLGFDPWAVRPREEAAQLGKEGVPLLVIHSSSDEVVPFEHARLFTEADPAAEFWQLGGYGHVQAYRAPDYEEHIQSFLTEALPPAREAALAGSPAATGNPQDPR